MSRAKATGLRVSGAASLALAALVVPQAASAHHSFAMFDHVNRITLAGTVTRFEWTNPHVYIELEVPDGKGGGKHFSIECASVNVLMRGGWKFTDVKKGDKVTLLVNPLKDGTAGGMLETATFADGRTLGDSNPPGGVFER
jgi:hypothetical protein